MRVLGIETSCDETAAAVVERRAGGHPVILSSVVHSQIEDHAAYGGVVPEIAARAHVELLDSIIARALAEADLTFRDIDSIAVTAGPGLAGGLIAGLMTAKALSAATGLPYHAINHLEGHALTPGLTDPGAAPFPYLLLLVSGGHTQFVAVRAPGDYHRIATTIDDALGEAFDKTAKLLGLPYPGGPAVEAAAQSGDPHRFDFPRPMLGKADPSLSFSGLKTAVRRAAMEIAPVSERDIADICASFQLAVTETLADRTRRAMEIFADETQMAEGSPVLVVSGGVAANIAIRSMLEDLCGKAGWGFHAPPLALCTDNAAMIAWAGLQRLEGPEGSKSDPMDLAPRTRWPLDEISRPLIGSGKRGAKA